MLPAKPCASSSVFVFVKLALCHSCWCWSSKEERSLLREDREELGLLTWSRQSVTLTNQSSKLSPHLGVETWRTVED